LRIRIITACVLLTAVASLSQFDPDPLPAIGGYGVVATERQTYIWADSVSPWSAGSIGYRLDFGNRVIIYSLTQNDLCLHGYYQSTDYNHDFITDCVMMRDTSIGYFRFWDTSFFHIPVHKMIAGKLPDGQPAYIGYEMIRDTLSLSTIWVRLGDPISTLLPGYWPMDTVALFCRRAIARYPVLKARTREDWSRDYEGSRITRFTWKLLPLPDAIAGSRRQAAVPPLAPGVDALGRRLTLWEFPRLGALPLSR
jgi:hypothetical protein